MRKIFDKFAGEDNKIDPKTELAAALTEAGYVDQRSILHGGEWLGLSFGSMIFGQYKSPFRPLLALRAA